MDQYLEFTINIAQKAGQKLQELYKTTPPITRGTPKEIKTQFDLIADEIIKQAIEHVYPEHSYLTEETGFIDKKSDFLWIIDPLDGTGNFVNANPFFGVSIALYIKGEPYLGVIEAPALQERYYALKNAGATYEDLKTGKKENLQVSTTQELSKSYLVSCEGGTKDKLKPLQYFNQFYSQTKDFRKLGSAALELAWVAVGRADGYLTAEISSWDIAAGMIIVEEAGGKILDFNLQPFQFEDLQKPVNILAYNNNLHFDHPINYE